MLTREEIVERLKSVERRDYYIEEIHSWGGGGLEWMPSERGSLVHWSYIEAIIKEAESE